jgi:dCMP deaminase
MSSEPAPYLTTEVFNTPDDNRRRMNRDGLFLSVAQLFGKRSTCPRAQVGAVAVRDRRIIATGYVGSPAGTPHCTELGCLIRGDGCVRTIHAEANVVAFAARAGASLDGTSIYCTHSPCLDCAKLLANTGIKEFVFITQYRDAMGIGILNDVNVKVRQVES